MLLQRIRLRFGTPREMKPIGPQIDTALVTRNIIARRRSALYRLLNSISSFMCLVRALAVHKAAVSPMANSTNEKIMSDVVTPSRLKLAAPQI